MPRLSRLAVVALVLAGAAPLAAQNYRDVTDTERSVRGYFGANLQVSFPQGEFDQFVGEGVGVGLHGTFLLGGSGHVGLRVAGSWIQYGRSSERIPFPGLPGISVDLTTSNDIYSFGVGPEFQAGSGALHVYGYGTAGFSNFRTSTQAEGSSNTNPFAESTNFSDWTWALAGGGGVMFQVAYGRTPVWIDGGLRYQGHGRTRYLREGSLDTDNNGNVVLSPIESETNMLVMHLGVQVGF